MFINITSQFTACLTLQVALFALFEHAAGYGLFKVQEFEEIGMLLPQIEASITDLPRFNSIVKLVSFSPFKTAVTALENINAISEGIMPEDLHNFLDLTVPKSKKVTLGVSDPKLAAAISEAAGIQCSHIGAVPEIIRGKILICMFDINYLVLMFQELGITFTT